MYHTEKCNYCTSISLQKLLVAHDCLPLWHVANNVVMGVVDNNMIAYFQEVYTVWMKSMTNKWHIL